MGSAARWETVTRALLGVYDHRIGNGQKQVMVLNLHDYAEDEASLEASGGGRQVSSYLS